jgi:phage-related protein
MKMQIFKLFGSILIDNDKADKSLSKTEKKAEGVGSKFGSMIGTAAKWGAGLAAGAGVAIGGMVALGSKVGNMADEILDLNSIAGMSTDSIQQWRKAAEVAGVAQDAMATASQKLTRNLDTMRLESNKGNKALQELGYSLDDVKNMSADQRMDVLTKALSEVDDKTERARLGTDLFAGSWKEIAPVVDLGAEAMNKAKDSANIISEEDLKKANDFRISLADMKDQASFFVTEIGIALLPMLQGLFDWIQEKMPLIKETMKVAFEFIGGLISGTIEWIKQIIGWVQNWFSQTDLTLSDMKESFMLYLNFIINYWKFIFNTAWKLLQTILGYIVPYIQEKLAVIQQFWQENGEQIMQAVENVFNFIKDTIEFLMPAIQKIIEVAWEVISGIFDSALGIIMGLIETFTGLFTGDWEKMGEGIERIWNALWNAIKVVLEGAWDLLKIPLKYLWDEIAGWFTGLKDDAIQWGKNMIQGFIDGIKAMASKVSDAVSGVIDGAKDFIGFNSPAEKGEGRNIVKWGANFIDGFLDGVESMKPQVGFAMNDIVGSMKPSSGGGATAPVTIGRGAFEGVIIMDDYGVDRLMDRVMERLSALGVK